MAPDPTFTFVGGPWCSALDFVIAFCIMISVSHIVNFSILYTIKSVRLCMCLSEMKFSKVFFYTVSYRNLKLSTRFFWGALCKLRIEFVFRSRDHYGPGESRPSEMKFSGGGDGVVLHRLI
jgi:type IV secretory pathway VirB3-like protein